MAQILYPIPSYNSGYARSRGDSPFPELWEKVAAWWAPSVGYQRTRLIDFVGTRHVTLGNTDNTNWTSGQRGLELTFDGSNETGALPATFSLASASAWSIAAWYKGTYSGSVNGTAAICGRGADPNSAAGFGLYGGKATYAHYNGGWVNLQSTTSVNDGAWHHILYVNYANQTGTMYVDGTPENIAASSVIAFDNNSLNINNLFYDLNAYLPGVMSYVGIWKRTLSAVEARLLANGATILHVKPRSVIPLIKLTQATYTATASLIAAAATLSASSAFTKPAYTGVSSLTAKGATLATSATFTKPVYTGAAALTTGAATLTAAATFAPGTDTATATLTVAAATLSASATVLNPPAVDAVGESNYQATDTYSWNHTCSGTDRALIVCVSAFDPLGSVGLTSGITYNGAALELLGGFSSGYLDAEIWGIVNPDVGTHLVEATRTVAVGSTGVSVSFNYVHQSEAYEALNATSGTNVGTEDASLALTTVTDNTVLIDAIATDEATVAPVAGQTERGGDTGAGGSGRVSTRGPVDADTNDMQWTGLTAGKNWVLAGIALRPAYAVSTYTGTADLIAAPATLAVTATFAPGTDTATAALTVAAATLAASGNFTKPVYTATAALAAGAATSAATGTFAPGTDTATAAFTVGAATLTASATFTKPAYTATSTLVVAPATLSASATFAPGTDTATASLLAGAATLASSATFTKPTYTGTVELTASAATLAATGTFAAGTDTGTAAFLAGAATLTAASEFTKPVYTATASLTAGAAALSAVGTFAPGMATATAALVASPATLTSSATFAPGTDTATVTLVAGAATLASSATFAPGTDTATATLLVGAATLTGSATFERPTYTGSAALTASTALLSASAISGPPTSSGVGSLIAGAATLAASATFVKPSYTATSTLVTAAATLSAAAAFTKPSFTAAASLTVAGATLSTTALFAMPTYTGTASLTSGSASLSATALLTFPTRTATAALVAGAATLGGVGTLHTDVYGPPLMTLGLIHIPGLKEGLAFVTGAREGRSFIPGLKQGMGHSEGF